MDTIKVYIFSHLLCLCVCLSFGGFHPDGVSEVSRSQDDQGNYEFGYKVTDLDGEHFRREGTDVHGSVIGSYGFTEADGRQRIVDYIADEHGFRAHVRTNEPGTAASNPAAVTIVKEGDHKGSPPIHLDLAATSISSSSRNPPKDHPERVFGVRLKPVPEDQHRNSDLDTSYVRNNPSGYTPEGISTVTESRRIYPYPPPTSRDPSAYYPPISPFPQNVDYPDYQSSRIPAQSSPPQPSDSVPDSGRPFVPPYGGGYEPFPINGYGNRNEIKRRPDVPMTAIHGGYGRGSPPQQHYGVTRIHSNAPRRPDYPPVQDDRILIPTRNDITIPSSNANSPNLVLRAVPIPNGIQAVHVDPSTGEVHRNVVYPAFDRQGRSYLDYNRNPRMFNSYPNRDYTNYDQDYGSNAYYGTDLQHFPGTRRTYSGTPSNSETSVYAGDGVILRNRQPLTAPKDLSLSTPSARDLAGLPPHFRYGYDSDHSSYRPGSNFVPHTSVPQQSTTLDNRYHGHHVVSDPYHPGYTYQVDYDNNENGFNPYFGALPSSPRTNAYPNYQRAGVLAPEYSKIQKSANIQKEKSSVEFLHDESENDESSSDKSH